MLSRTASNLFWTARYIERAESLARILEATIRLASLPTNYSGKSNEWQSAVEIAGSADLFDELYDVASEENVKQFLAFDPKNPSSIKNCLETARSNARSVRTALTSEMWDAINGAWLELKTFENKTMGAEEFSRFIDWVKSVSLAFDGSAYRTMLRRDAFWFTRLGLAIERADNTARILDVKYHVLLPEHEMVGGSLDYFQWTTILREVSAYTAYHWVYRQSIKPWLVADLLILNNQMPRSMASSYEILVRHLDLIADVYERRGASQRKARAMLNTLNNTKIDTIFQGGLHEFITSFIDANNELGAAIAEQYLI